jgi:RNA polymerase sigma factor (sigma-70 family)
MAENFVLQMSPANLVFQRAAQSSPAWQQFSDELMDLIQPGNPAAVSMGAFLRRTLHAFHLWGFHSEMEVLSEVYIRAYYLIHEQGTTLDNLSAWVRKTAHNVIREWSRKGQRSTALDWEVVDEREENQDHQLVLENDVAILAKAHQSLTKEEQRLLTLKIDESLSWREISAHYATEGNPTTEAALRQQKARILKKLRRMYHTLRPLTDISLARLQTREIQTRQSQQHSCHRLTMDRQLAARITTAARYYRRFIFTSGTPGHSGQAHLHQLAYSTGIATCG